MRLFPLQIFLISFLAHGVLGWGQLRGTFSRGEQDIQKKDHAATAGSNSSPSERVHEREREHRRRTNNRATINNAALASNNLNLNNRKLKWAEDHPEITKALMEERRKAEASMNATDSADKGDDYYDDDEALEKGDDYYEKLEEANAAKDNNSGDQGGHKNWEKETSESKVEDMTEASEGPGPVDSEEEEGEGEENSEDENDDEAPTEDESDDGEEEESSEEESDEEEEEEDETEDISDQGEEDDIDNQTPVEQNNEEEVEDIISTSSPTAAAVVTASPTVKSTDSPTIASTDSPTTSPTIASTDSPTISPTRLPTKKPTSVPAIVTGSPTQSPTAKKATPSPTIEIDDTLTADDDDSLNGSSDNSSSTDSPTASPTKITKWENAVDSSKEDEDSNRSSSEKDPTLEEIYEDLTPEQVEYLKHHEFVDEEKEAAKISVLYFVITLVLMIFTAQQMSESPDGVYANVCRLGITVAGLGAKIILLPFRKFCGLGGKQGYSHHLVTTSDPYSRTSRMEII